MSAPAPDWPNWRGPTFNGAAPEQALPTQFTRTEGLAWSSPLPGPSAATPIVLGDRVFISSTDSAGGSLVALCLDRKTGRELWRHKVADGISRDERSNYASPSPLTDGKHVWFFYGQGELVAYTLDGANWSRNIQNDFGAFAFQWTFASSPLLHDGRLYLQVLQRNVPVNGRGKTDGPIGTLPARHVSGHRQRPLAPRASKRRARRIAGILQHSLALPSRGTSRDPHHRRRLHFWT